MADVDVIITSNVGQVKAELERRIPIVLEALGIQAETNAVDEITSLGAVDTGRLRASITHQVDESDDSVIIGSPVEYAPYVELGTYKMDSRPFLRNAIMNYSDQYEKIVKEGLN